VLAGDGVFAFAGAFVFVSVFFFMIRCFEFSMLQRTSGRFEDMILKKNDARRVRWNGIERLNQVVDFTLAFLWRQSYGTACSEIDSLFS
jgi:hypothetical protein